MLRLLIIADDFTGGLDTGVQFAEKGIPTRVVTNPEVDFKQAAGDCQVLVVVAETRHLAAEDAYRTVYAVTQKAVRLEIPYLYKKTDSALRGNIGAELSAVLDASGSKTLAFLPAMPALNRTTVKGMHYIDGVPVAESVFGKDPFSPVKTSSVKELLAMQSSVDVWNVDTDGIMDHSGILLMDAQTDADVWHAGKKLKEKQLLHVMAGCAGFAAALPELLELDVKDTKPIPLDDGGMFVLCGSVNPITQRQLACAESNGFTRIHIRPDQKLNNAYFDTAEGKAALDGWCKANEQNPWMILDANDNADDNAQTLAYAQQQNMSIEDVRRCISRTLGKILPVFLQSGIRKTMMITGGDTLLQCMNQMEVWEMEPIYQVFPGVVLSRFRLAGKNHYAVTKSGGFGDENMLLNLRARILSQAKA